LQAPTEDRGTRDTLEIRDTHSGRWILYSSDKAHSEDCRRHPYEAIPMTIFLDTCVVNLLVKFADQIYQTEPIPHDVPLERAWEIEALVHLMQVGARANWIITTAPKALHELSCTRDAALRQSLVEFGNEFLHTHNHPYDHAIDLGRRSVGAPFLSKLPDPNDRELIGNAVGLGCEVFCTVDRTTILRFRDELQGMPLRILSPVEWWRHLKPWAGLLR
jgi:hypothetical protein